jgi:V/A-type H+/Na+-transporting ATPase subunit F
MTDAALARKADGQYRLKVVTTPGAALGFRLAGISVEEVNEDAAAERIAALLAEPDLGVLAVEQELLRRTPERLLAKVARKVVPVVLPFTFPRHWGEGGGGEAYVAELVRRAIGYHIKIHM